jgi:hypothetical protein
MTGPQTAGSMWHVSGDYCEACSCLFICSCSTSNFTLPPNRNDCKFALVFHIDRGRFGETSLENLNVAMVGFTPEGPMTTVGWSVGLLVDERADDAQRDALARIFRGQTGEPLAGLAPLITNFLGVEAGPIHYEKSGLRRAVSIRDRLDDAIEGFANPFKEGEHLQIDDPLHPSNPRLAIARSTRSHLHAFGVDWDDESGRNNGDFAAFKWQAS